MTPAEEVRRLARIRAHVAALDGDQWSLTPTDDGGVLDARSRDGGLVPIATISGKASFDETELLTGALGHLRFLLGLLDRCARRVRELAPGSATAAGDAPPSGHAGRREREEAPNHAAEAAMKCAEPAFKRFLIERHGLESPATDERAAQRLRGVLGITSRRALNDDQAAAARWRALRDEFKAWRRG